MKNSIAYCPRCGVPPGEIRAAMLRAKLAKEATGYNFVLSESSRRAKLDPKEYGTHYDAELDEWQCVECGAFWDGDGQKSIIEELYGE